MNLYPSIFNIGAKDNFFKNLTFEIIYKYLIKGNTKDLTIILPTKISCQILKEHLKEAGIGYVKTCSINEIDAGNNGLSRIEQVSKINEIILKLNIDKFKNFTSIIALSEYFASLIQKLELYEIDFYKVIKLIDEDLPVHKQEIFFILKKVLNDWKDKGFITKAGANSRAMYKLNKDIIIAGISYDIPSIIHLMSKAKIIVFQGVNLNFVDADWENINFTHSQYNYKNILNKLGKNIKDIENLTQEKQPSNFISNALKPAKSCSNWYRERETPCNIKYLKCHDLHSEAKSIINILQTSNYNSAMVVTQDDSLIIKLIAHLKLKNIEASIIRDYPLKNTNLGILFQLSLNLLSENFSLLSSLAFLKHNLINIDKEIITQIEMVIRDKKFYGSNIFDIIDGDEKLKNIIEAASKFKEGFSGGLKKLSDLFKLNIEFIEKVAIDPFSSKEGGALKDYIEQIARASESFVEIYPKNYPQIFYLYIKSAYYRPEFEKRKIIISKPIDVRLQSADLVILAGLNENIWPAKPPIDPCLNRYLIKKIGLPEVEAQMGEEAKDFELLAQNKEVILTRSDRIEGVFTTPSRWLSRILTFAKNIEYLDPLHEKFTHKEEVIKNFPCPPLSYRPKQLSVTKIDKLIFNPYHIYVDLILNLKTITPITKELSMIDFGIFIHKALEIYHYNHKEPNLEKLLEAADIAIFKLQIDKAKLYTTYWQRFLRIAKWFVANETSQNKTFLETFGKVLINENFELTAKADRLEYLPDDSLMIVDYKTGSLPTKNSIASGENLQLLLEGVIGRRGGYNYQKSAQKVSSLRYIQLSGGEIPAEILEVNIELIDKAEEYLSQIVTFYENENNPYLYTKKKKLGYCEYEHLARF